MAAIRSKLVMLAVGALACGTAATRSSSRGVAAAFQPPQASSVRCTPAGPLSKLLDLGEASGLAVSRRHPGILWSHNDSGATLFAVSLGGVIKGRVRLAVSRVDDWEDVAVGACPQDVRQLQGSAASCLYAADMGDNRTSRRHITIYRVPEPAPTDEMTAAADAFRATYPDGPRDAEAFFVTSANDWFVITKDAPVALYRFPNPPQAGTTVQLQRIGTFDKTLPEDKVTGAGGSPDGRWVVLRTHRSVIFYRASDLQSGGDLRQALHFDVSPLREPQGEGVALAADGTVYLAGEAGGRNGTFARIHCALPR
jgi:hypothetical protein